MSSSIGKITDNFKPTSDITIQQILNNLLNSDDNLSLKTEIYNPKKLATLYTLAIYLKKKKYTTTYKIIIDFIEIYLKYMISNKRQSRNEVIKALTNLTQPKENLIDDKI